MNISVYASGVFKNVRGVYYSTSEEGIYEHTAGEEKHCIHGFNQF